MNLLTTNPFDDDHFMAFLEPISINTALGLHALQHRGQEATGIVSFDGKSFMRIAELDMLTKILEQDQHTLRALPVMLQLVITVIQQVANQMHA